MSGDASGLGAEQLRKRVSAAVEPILRRSAQLGFLGGMPMREQIDHALGFVFSVESTLGRPPASVLDLGSGGGLPGLVLASCWPESALYLVDSNERRTAFLSSEIQTEFPDHNLIEVVHARAEEVAREDRLRDSIEVVTARSFGSPAVTVECGAPLLSMNGILVVSEPPGDQQADRWNGDGVAELGMTIGDALRFDSRFGYRVLTKSLPTPDRYPRRVGIPAKRPLF
jgi:16S rRNA (guanine527-N7)-methyltransferase